MDNKTSGGNTKQGKRKRTSPPPPPPGRPTRTAAAVGVENRRAADKRAAEQGIVVGRARKRKMQRTTATLAKRVREASPITTATPAATLLSIVNSFLDPFKKTFPFFFRSPPPMQSPPISPPPPVKQKRKVQSISRISKSVINSIKNIANDENKVELFRKILQIFDSLHDFNIIFKKDPILIDKILYDNNISEDDNNISEDIKKNIETIFKRAYFEKDLLNNLIKEEERKGEKGKIITRYIRGNKEEEGKILSIFQKMKEEEVIADANTIFNKIDYCNDEILKEYAPYFSIATQHDLKGKNKCDINYKDDCYKCEIESDITLSKEKDGLLIIEAVKLKEGTRDGRYISYTLNGEKYYNDKHHDQLGMTKFIAICADILNIKIEEGKIVRAKRKGQGGGEISIEEIKDIINTLYNLNIDTFKKKDNESKEDKKEKNINYIRSLLDIKRLGDLLQIKVAQHNNYLFITGDQMAFIISTLGYNTSALWGGRNEIISSSETQQQSKSRSGQRDAKKRKLGGSTHNSKTKQYSIEDIYDIYNETLTKLINNIPEDKGEVGDNTVIAFEFMFVADIFLSNYEHLTEKEKIAIDELIKELTNKTNNIPTSEDKLSSARNKTKPSEDKLPRTRNETPTSVEFTPVNNTKRTQSNRNNPNTMKTTRTAPVTVIPSAAVAAGGGEEYE